LGADGAYDSNENFEKYKQQNVIPAIPIRKNFLGKINGITARKE